MTDTADVTDVAADRGANSPTDAATTPADNEPGIEAGTYELLRRRLEQQAGDLAGRATSLNDRRLDHFGATRLEAVGSKRIRTENNCVPRDIAAIGDWLLFGYNVFIGLKAETSVDDVFTLHRLDRADGLDFAPVVPDASDNWLNDPDFASDFRELYTYYREARLRQLHRVEGKLLMVFQIGERLDDLRVFRWAVTPDGHISYLDARGDRDYTFPPNQDFEWVVATRDDHITGRHPHISILDEVFVETVGGDLTIKVEDNTEDGHGIYREPVDEADQSLADADVAYARVGSLILLMVRPYKEHQWRHFVFNTKTRAIERIDAIGQACQQLPEDHGIIFPGGYYLMNGETKTFAADIDDMVFKEVVRSPNGEDVLYVFNKVAEGRSILLSYNVIRKEIASPIHCHGYTLFRDGTLVIFQAKNDEPTRLHVMQIWQTPFMTDVFFAQQPVGDNFFDTIGNPELVRGVSDALSLVRLVNESTPSMVVYDDLNSAAGRMTDAYHWLGDSDAGDLLAPITEIQATGELIVDEFEKTEGQRARAAEVVSSSAQKLTDLYREIRTTGLDTVEEVVTALSTLRAEQGHLITLREVRYVDLPLLEQLEAELLDEFDTLSAQAIDFLAADNAFDSYHAHIADLGDRAEQARSVAESDPIESDVSATTGGLELLTEVVGGLDIGDATVRTGILERISEILGGLNRTRALLDNRRTELRGAEAIAEFGAEFMLFEQAITGALAMSSDPQACDEQLAKLVLQIESLDGRFGEFENFGDQLATKRDDIYEAFSSRKQALLDERQRKAQRLADAGNRILESLDKRVDGFTELDEINTFFASDALVMRLRALGDQLRDLDDAVKADELNSRLKAAREDAARALRDRQDIYEEGAILRLGRHRFSVSTQKPDLTVVPSGDGLDYLITGTDYREPITDTDFLDATRPYWDQLLVSESSDVYRGEYLATSLLSEAEAGADGLTLGALIDAAAGGVDGLLTVVRERAASRYDEGYERGVHDHDAALILDKLLQMHATAGLLRFPAEPRALATLFWAFGAGKADQSQWRRRADSLVRLRATYGTTSALTELASELTSAIQDWAERSRVPVLDITGAGTYLAEELAHGQLAFTTSSEASHLVATFHRSIDSAGHRQTFDDDARAVADLGDRHALVLAWLEAYAAATQAVAAGTLNEATALVLTDGRIDRVETSALTSIHLEGLLGRHDRIRDRSMELRLDDVLSRTTSFRAERVPGFRDYQKRRHNLLETRRNELRLSEFEPKVMSAFVRNHLIDEVYLPIIGDNLAKQIGTAGVDKRTDQMGLLLLISPPGYGKTTLMEYVANRLGMVFVKINGPALGHAVTSVDPAEAPNATARLEINKINFALEMANNVLLYVDDIQHTSPEFLQKFISMTDAQRRMEGVWRGNTRTYDLRGKRFAVCMAGNPYTESGEKFAIPDMLANRADTYNLGDILTGNDELFELSYIENTLTSNPTLAPLTTHDREDIVLLVRMARGEPVQSDQLDHPWSGAELEAILAVLQKLLRIQEVLLAVNQLYISSAAQDNAFRTEPAFQLQGSYRNMNKLAEKVVPVMNDDELEALIDDHYQGEAQTLTTGAEWNVLRLRELRGVPTDDEQNRLAEIRSTFQRRQSVGGEDDDPTLRMVMQLAEISGGLSELGAIVATEGERAATESAELSAAESQATLERRQAREDSETARAEAAAAVEAARSELAALRSRTDADVETARAAAAGAQAEVEVARLATDQARAAAEAATDRAQADAIAGLSSELASIGEALRALLDRPVVATAVTGPTPAPAPPSSLTPAPSPGPSLPAAPPAPNRAPARPAAAPRPPTPAQSTPPQSTPPHSSRVPQSSPVPPGPSREVSGPPDPSVFGRRFFAAYLANDDINFYWEVGTDGWAVRQIEMKRSTGVPLAAATLNEWQQAGNDGRLGEGTGEGAFTDKALDPADPTVQTQAISGHEFEQRWAEARAHLDG